MFDELSLYPRSNAIIGTIGLPWWNIGGNHDLNFEAPDRKYSRETFKRVFGPNYYAFFYGADAVSHARRRRLSRADPTKPRGAGKYEGRFDEAQLEFVRNVLAHTPDDTLIVAVMHIPIRTFLDDERLPEHRRTGTRSSRCSKGALHCQLLRTYPHDRASLFRRRRRLDGRDAAPSSYPDRAVGLVVERTVRSSRRGHRRQPRRHAERLPHPLGRRTDYSTRFVPAKEPNGRQMRLSIDSRFHGISKDADREFRQVQLLGSPVPRDALRRLDADRQRVRRRREDKGRHAASATARRSRWTATPRPDPFVEEVFARNEATKKAWVKAETSSHIWTARLPADLAPGAYRIEVEAVNEYGKVVTGRLALEVTG